MTHLETCIAVLERELRRVTHTHCGDVKVRFNEDETIDAWIGGNHELGQMGDHFQMEIGSDDDGFRFVEQTTAPPRIISFDYPDDWPIG